MKVLDDAVGTAFPGAVAVCSVRGDVAVRHAVGDATLDTIYDLASLTKPMAIGSILLAALERGHVSLDDMVFGKATVRQLAGHTSGLPAHRHFYRDGPVTRERVLAEPLAYRPDTRAVYSDLGYMMLGWFFEDHYNAPLETLFGDVGQRFGLVDTGFLPLSQPVAAPMLRRVAPTEDCAWRGRILRGEVHDQNAWALGGVCGHAGLFGTADDVHRWAVCLLDAWHGRPSPVSREWIRRLLRPRDFTSWRLVFDSPSPTGYTSAGASFGPDSFGHLGFTGTSVWIEPEKQWVCVLLANRVHPCVDPGPAIRALRPRFHDAFAVVRQAVVEGVQTR